MVDFSIVEEGPEAIPTYGEVPISFEVRSRVQLGPLREGALLEEPEEEPYWKDYDKYEDERPCTLAERFDVSQWGVLRAATGRRTVGSAMLAWKSANFDMLEDRHDLAILADIRVAPEVRGNGIGTALFKRAEDWAKRKGCTELRVETQDVNVAACRFYSAMGCIPIRIVELAYLPYNEDAMILWSKRL